MTIFCSIGVIYSFFYRVVKRLFVEQNTSFSLLFCIYFIEYATFEGFIENVWLLLF